MAALEVPKAGLSLIRELDNKNKAVSTAAQVMRLNLKQSATEELLRSLRKNETVRVRFGKRQLISYADKYIQFSALPETNRSELYERKDDDEEAIYFTGALSHRLETQEAQDATAGADTALAELQKSLKSYKDQKEQNEARLVTDRMAAGKKVPINRGTHLKPLSDQRSILGRSTPGSPAMGALSPNSSQLPATSTPLLGSLALSKEDQLKLAAMKTPLTHLLAVEPQTVKDICSKLRCSKELCKRLLTKHAEEIKADPGKYELKDKVFKDLDVWGFKYPSQNVRQKAVDRAITAFDRMRVTRKDEAWQMLLPKAERGKGKVLSRINLEGAPKVLPPKAPDSDVEAKAATPKDSGKMTPQQKKTQPKPTSHPSTNGKRTSGDEEDNKPRPKQSNSSASQPVKKTARPESTKFKSAERVEDSDEDTDMSDAQPLIKIAKPVQKNSVKSAPAPAPRNAAPKERPQPTPTNTNSKETSRLLTTTRPRTDSSPQKPSPLASSPPTNASDGDSSSKASNSSFASSPPQRVDKNQKPSSQANGKTDKSSTNGVKRKAEDGSDRSETKRHQTNGAGVIDRGRTQDTTRDRAISDAKNPVKALTPQTAANMSRVASNMSSGSGSTSPPDYEQMEKKAREFKSKHDAYREFHNEVTKKGSRATEQEINRLIRMHTKIKEMKQEIWKAFDKGCAVE